MSLDTHTYVAVLGICVWVELLGHRVCIYLVLADTLFSKVVTQFTLIPAAYEGFSCSVSLPILEYLIKKLAFWWIHCEIWLWV